MKKFIALTAALACMAAMGAVRAHAQQISLDNAIRNAAWGVASGIESNATVAVLSMQAGTARMSDYLVNEMTVALIGLQAMQGFTVISRHQVDQTMAGLSFGTSDWIDGAAAQSIGRLVGAQVVVTGGLDSVAGFFRLRAQAIDVETGVVVGIHTSDVQNNHLVAYLMGAPDPAAQAAAEPQEDRRNAFSGGVTFSLGDGFGFGFNIRYDRQINHFFSMGAGAFYNFPIDFGISGIARLFFGRSPFFAELGLGFGAMEYSYTHHNMWGPPHTNYYLNVGFLITPAVGARFGGTTRGFFGTPFVSFPMVLGSGGLTIRVQPGVAVGGAW